MHARPFGRSHARAGLKGAGCTGGVLRVGIKRLVMVVSGVRETKCVRGVQDCWPRSREALHDDGEKLGARAIDESEVPESD